MYSEWNVPLRIVKHDGFRCEKLLESFKTFHGDVVKNYRSVLFPLVLGVLSTHVIQRSGNASEVGDIFPIVSEHAHRSSQLMHVVRNLERCDRLCLFRIGPHSVFPNKLSQEGELA